VPFRSPVAVIAALALGGCAHAGVQAPVSAEPVTAAERAFAARGQEVSVKQAFAEFAAPDGVLMTPQGPQNAHRQISGWPDRDDKGFIKWWPIYAGIAASGDLGFTTGPATYADGARGYTHFFTVWKKQPDGSWKWLIDMGARAPNASPFGPDTPVEVSPLSPVAPTEASAAWASLQAAEAELARASGEDHAAAYRARMAPEGRVNGFEGHPAVGREAVAAALARRPARIAMTSSGGGVSAAGDLGWTHGRARWSEAGAEKSGGYMRVWRRRPAGWVVLADLVTPD